jgi:predicted CopG family antitoxin
MPKAGFKSITVSEEVYDKFFDVFEKNKPELVMKGINSFSGYVTYMLEQTMQKDKTFARYAPKIEKVAVDEDRVVLKDNIKNRIAEVTIQKGELFCQLCEEKDCVHIGYVFSLPDVYEVLNSRGIKHPR